MATNQLQEEYWSTAPGQQWIRFENELDIVFDAVNDALIERAQPKPGERIIDIGCGTGATTRAFASRVTSNGFVAAVDISEPLLSHAKSQDGAVTEYRLIDAQSDPIGNSEFDLAISRFGTMFFEDPSTAFANIPMAMRPGGRLVVVGWAGIDGNPWFETPRDGAVARLGPPENSDPNGPGPLGFQNIDHVNGILANAGFSNVTAERTLIMLKHPGPVDKVAGLAASIGPAARIIKKYNGTSEDIDAIKAYVLRGFRNFETSEGVCIPAWLNFFSALNPSSTVNELLQNVE